MQHNWGESGAKGMSTWYMKGSKICDEFFCLHLFWDCYHQSGLKSSTASHWSAL